MKNNKFNKIIELLQIIKKQKQTQTQNIKTCRICFEEINNNNNNNDNSLISPCKCKGSMKWVHHNCLVKWITISNKKRCQTCHYTYNISINSNYEFLHNNIGKLSILLYSFFSFICLLIYNLIYKKKIFSVLTYYSFYQSLKIQIILFCFIIISLKFIPKYQPFLNSLLDEIHISNQFYYSSMMDFCYYFYKIIKKMLTIFINYYDPQKIKIFSFK